MKNKSKTYTLLVLVLGIWGIIGYKVLSTVNPKDPKIVEQDFNKSFNPKLTVEADTFSIAAVNRDPFLGTLQTNRKRSTKRKITKSNTTKIVWMPILYHGNVSKQNSKTEVFVISITGQQYLMKAGQTINEIKLISGNTKTIVVVYKGVKKTITKT